MMDDYCMKCHADAYEGWFHSAHHFSSFNNPAYLASVQGNAQGRAGARRQRAGSRWCAGCHDPVPFFSAATFDDPTLDEPIEPTGQAGITCTVATRITHVNSTRGNADYTSRSRCTIRSRSAPARPAVSQSQLVKAKPAFHKKTFLKPVHRTAEFCSTCHKVHFRPSSTTTRTSCAARTTTTRSC